MLSLIKIYLFFRYIYEFQLHIILLIVTILSSKQKLCTKRNNIIIYITVRLMAKVVEVIFL